LLDSCKKSQTHSPPIPVYETTNDQLLTPQQTIIFKVITGAMLCNSPIIQLVPLQQALQIQAPFTLLQPLPSAPQSQVWVQLAPHVPAEQFLQ
jgi:hypothetical protein